MTSAFFVVVILPFALFYYESDEDKTFKLRLWTALKYELLLIVIVSIILFGSFAGLRYAQLPFIANTCKFALNDSKSFFNADVNASSSGCVRTDEELQITVSFPIYVIGITCWLGWFFLIFFLGSGLTALPVDLINQFRFRPKPMNEVEFNNVKHELAKKVERMLQIGKALLEDKTRSDAMSGFKGWKERRAVGRRQNEFETNCMLAEKEFQRLDNTAQYRNKVEPLLYFLKLFLGLCSIVISLIFVIHMFVYLILKINDRPVHPFINNLLEAIEISNASVFSTVLFAVIGYYFMFATMKGNVRIGMRCFCFTFYPLVPNETFVNSFIFNALIMNIWMFSLIQYLTDMFKDYVRQTSISMIFSVQIKNMYFYQYFLRYNVFIYILTAWIFISLIYFILKPVERINVGQQIKKKDLAARA
eukprot:403333058